MTRDEGRTPRQGMFAGRNEAVFGAALRVWVVVGAIVIGSAILNVLDVLAPVIEFFAVGSLVAFVAAPIVNGLSSKGVPRGAAAPLRCHKLYYILLSSATINEKAVI